MKRRIFLDSGVLIAAFRGSDEIAQKALEVIDDPDIEFASSVFVKLETLPMPRYNKRKSEAEFYDEFFKNITAWAEPGEELAQSALDEASKNGLGAMDALHVMSAVKCKADEFITAEQTTKPFSRVTKIPVRFISQ